MRPVSFIVGARSAFPERATVFRNRDNRHQRPMLADDVKRKVASFEVAAREAAMRSRAGECRERTEVDVSGLHRRNVHVARLEA